MRTEEKRGTRVRRATGALGLLSVAVTGAVAFGGHAGATVPGQPGVTQAGTNVYVETFENNNAAPATTAPLLKDYVGGAAADNETYTAGPDWIGGTHCNGFVLASQDRLTSANQSSLGCANADGYVRLRAMAWAAGSFEGSATPSTNHMLAGYTDPSYGTSVNTLGTLEAQTKQQLTVRPNRYYSFAVTTAAANCEGLLGQTGSGSPADPVYQFSLIGASGTVPLGAQINGCKNPNKIYYYQGSTTSPAAGTTQIPVSTGPSSMPYVAVGRHVTSQAIYLPGSSLGVMLRNLTTTTWGNDAAIDNIEVLDVTPQLDKSFSPALIPVGGTSTLTFTVTNTNELDAKTGWKYTDALPTGVVLANPTGATTTCLGATGAAGTTAAITGAAGSSSLTVNGSLAKGQKSCTISVKVTSNTPGTYTNTGCESTTGSGQIAGCTSNITNIQGLNPPSSTDLKVTDEVDLAVDVVAPATAQVGDTIPYTVTVTNDGPFAVDTYTVTNIVPLAFDNVTTTDPNCVVMPTTTAGTPVVCTVTNDPLAPGETRTFDITATATDAGTFTDTANVDTAGDTNPANNDDSVQTTIVSPVPVPVVHLGSGALGLGGLVAGVLHAIG